MWNVYYGRHAHTDSPVKEAYTNKLVLGEAYLRTRATERRELGHGHRTSH